MRFLVVEDDFTSRLVLKKLLQPYGECDTAVNGLEAVQAFNISLSEQSPYDAIFLDIMMPEMDGKEALKAIREKEKELGVLPKDETKIIMVTALDTAQDVIESYYKGGCTSYLVKPIEKRKIIKALKDLNIIE